MHELVMIFLVILSNLLIFERDTSSAYFPVSEFQSISKSFIGLLVPFLLKIGHN